MNEITRVYKILFRMYGAQGWWPLLKEGYEKNRARSLTKGEQFEVSIGAILAQNTNWKNAEKALQELAQLHLLDRGQLRKIKVQKLAQLIRSSGYFRQKAKKMKAFLALQEPFTREQLLAVWGIGKETADSILLYAYQQPIFVIDAYTKRIFSRIGLCRGDVAYDELQELLHANLPKDPQLFNEYHALLVEHAKRYCRKDPLCKACPLAKSCAFGRKRVSAEDF